MAIPKAPNAYLKGDLSTTLQLVVARQCEVRGVIAGNTSTVGVGFLQMFDAASTDDVTLGTTVPKLAIPVGQIQYSGATEVLTEAGALFENGLVVAATTTATGSSALASAMTVNIIYE